MPRVSFWMFLCDVMADTIEFAQPFYVDVDQLVRFEVTPTVQVATYRGATDGAA